MATNPQTDRTRRPGARFWVQCVVGGIGVSVALAVLVRAELGIGLGLALLVLAGTLAVLWWLERGKAGPAQPQPDYAAELRSVTDSRRAIVAAFEIERRRIELDLHDGAQQYLVAGSMKLGEAQLLAEQRAADPALRTLLEGAQDDTESALRALRTTVAGIHPRVLADLGLEAAVRDVAGRAAVPVKVRVPHPLPQLPEGVIAAAYFLVSEAVTNAAKYAGGAPTTVLLAADDALHVSIVDSGPGGASIVPGRGLAGMRERLASFGGTLTLSSPSGGPTTVQATIPLLLHAGETAVVWDGAR